MGYPGTFFGYFKNQEFFLSVSFVLKFPQYNSKVSPRVSLLPEWHSNFWYGYNCTTRWVHVSWFDTRILYNKNE